MTPEEKAINVLENHWAMLGYKRGNTDYSVLANDIAAAIREAILASEARAEKAEADYKALLDKAGAYCGARYSAGGAHESTIKAYLDLRQFIIDARAALKEQDNG